MKNKKALNMLKTCRGQIDGIIKMIEDERYCIDISNQILASQALLKSVNKIILSNHLGSCVKEAAINHNNLDEKITEITGILNKLL